ncbi:MAG: phosphate acyltransferase [Thermaerobacter sp.]|nr:phosphate acyltransferase [Thermaerobacter sp.]
MTPHQQRIVEHLRAQAQAVSGTVIFTDGEDERVALAACDLAAHSAITPILIGRRTVIRRWLPSVHDQHRLTILDLTDPGQKQRVTEAWEASGLGPTLSDWMSDPAYVGAVLVRQGFARGMVGGANAPTAAILRAGLRVIGVDPARPFVSGAFGMILPTPLANGLGVLTFGDAAVIPRPTAQQLAVIAMNTASVAEQVFGMEPRVALLSFSTKGSAEHSDIGIVREAVAELQARQVGFPYDGELQADAAIVPEVAIKKAPSSTVAGQANVLIFPNLDAANIAYKLVQRVGGAVALGVILSGFNQPINDLSRGCSVEDVINIATVTLLQAHRGTASHSA